ncbi:hypothetical protein LCGC14_0936650 [marine sediment metagenome]|uniref:Uncharacterized protein n=1 Tax=marine sediment metagenome TaxID=412755 RepID=A0A0F9P7G6_9ZZZZ
MEIKFPIKGWNEGAAVEGQPPLTSPSLRNVRPFDTEEERIRGGQRPGLSKASDDRIVGDNPVTLMKQIAITYVEPVA